MKRRVEAVIYIIQTRTLLTRNKWSFWRDWIFLIGFLCRLNSLETTSFLHHAGPRQTAWGMGSPRFKRLTSSCLLSPVFPQLAAWSPAAAGLSPGTASRGAPGPCLWSSAFPSQAATASPEHLATLPFPRSFSQVPFLLDTFFDEKQKDTILLFVCLYIRLLADHFYHNLLDSICVVSMTMARALAGFPLASVAISPRVRLRQAQSGSACPSSLAQACHGSGSRNWDSVGQSSSTGDRCPPFGDASPTVDAPLSWVFHNSAFPSFPVGYFLQSWRQGVHCRQWSGATMWAVTQLPGPLTALPALHPQLRHPQVCVAACRPLPPMILRLQNKEAVFLLIPLWAPPPESSFPVPGYTGLFPEWFPVECPFLPGEIPPWLAGIQLALSPVPKDETQAPLLNTPPKHAAQQNSLSCLTQRPVHPGPQALPVHLPSALQPQTYLFWEKYKTPKKTQHVEMGQSTFIAGEETFLL